MNSIKFQQMSQFKSVDCFKNLLVCSGAYGEVGKMYL